MKKGVCFAVYGESHLARVQVAISSLRKVYSGPITLFYSMKNSEIKSFCKKLKLGYKPIKIENPDLLKVHVMTYSPYDISLYIDADTLIVGSIEPIFSAIQEWGLAVPNFMGFKPSEPFLKNRFDIFSDLKELYEDIFKLPVAVTSGVFGWKKTHGIVAVIEDFVIGALERGSENAFDVCLHTLATQYDHWILSPIFCMSSRYNNKGMFPTIIHYHGNRHTKEGCPLAKRWIAHFHELRITSNVIVGTDLALKRFLDESIS